MRYFFVEPDELARPVVTITGQEARHIGKVLRLKPGMVVGLSDGRGLQGEARIQTMAREQVELAVLRRYPSPREPQGAFVVAQAMLKDQKMDLLVRQLTELGMTGWRPFISARSVPQPDARRQAARAERWERIAREAVKQCRRGRVPDIGPVGGFAAIIEAGDRFDTRILFWEGAREPLRTMPAEDSAAPRRVLMVVGPEGGFADEEAAAAEQAGFRLASLGPRILRAETAAIAAGTLVQHLYGDLGQVPPEDGAFASDDGASESVQGVSNP
jgi:16S rRNA (uracil1498-N3)-methyltransferase